jgi:DNA-binding PadR family transcriptional regulator
VVLLALLAERPMHPYRIQQLIKERGTDKVANVAQPNSVYQTIDALLRGGLVAVEGTARDERRPERTVYDITPAGLRTLDEWLATLLSELPRDFPGFPAALSLLALLEPSRVQHYLETRAAAIEARLVQVEADLASVPDLPRLFVVEVEYQRAMLQAELGWVRGIVSDLTSGRLTWDPEALKRWAAAADAGR